VVLFENLEHAKMGEAAGKTSTESQAKARVRHAAIGAGNTVCGMVLVHHGNRVDATAVSTYGTCVLKKQYGCTCLETLWIYAQWLNSTKILVRYPRCTIVGNGAWRDSPSRSTRCRGRGNG
jgi:hypothetical protein